MFNRKSFTDCITDFSVKRGFGTKRKGEILDRFNGLADGFEAGGMSPTDASSAAMARTLGEIGQATKDKAHAAAKMLSVQASFADRISRAKDLDTSLFVLDGKKGSAGTAIARAGTSFVEGDPRIGGANHSTEVEITRGVLYRSFGDVLDKFTKGWFGVQRGRAHESNFVLETHGQATGDKLAGELATAYKKTQRLYIQMFRAAGGAINELEDFALPQRQSSVRLMKAGFDKWSKDTMGWLDWNKMRWPDGSPIAPDQRMKVLEQVYNTLTTDGANKIDPAAARGVGTAFGNKVDQHRFLRYKDGEAWSAMHEAYGDGNAIDVMFGHIEEMANQIATVKLFGRNPDLAYKNLVAQMTRAAADIGGQAPADVAAIVKNKLDPMWAVATRQVAMDPNSFLGHSVKATSNLLIAAQLGSASVLAIPGDFVQSAAVKAFNGMDMFGGIGRYISTVTGLDGGLQRELAFQSGFVMDSAISSLIAHQRWTGAAMASGVTSRISDAVIRASMLSGHTDAARWSGQAEMLGMFARDAGKKLEDIEYERVFKRYGITGAEWDKFRGLVQPYAPRDGTKFLRPSDLLDHNEMELFRKFQGMVLQESRMMVPDSTIEAQVYLRGTTSPDTMMGLMMHSVSMYKNFAVSMPMIYGRLALTSKSAVGRVGFLGGLVASMTLVGAVGTQLREISKGRDPLPMNTATFWGKAILGGGGLSIFGDTLFAGINQFGGSAGETAAGPLLGLATDTANLALGSSFAMLDAMDRAEQWKGNFLARSVQFAKRYTPGTSIWYARAALEHSLWDRLEELADPQIYQKRQRRVNNQQRDFGNDYWWRPGDRTPERAPQL